jgi:CheY-like chemotaxis protein
MIIVIEDSKMIRSLFKKYLTILGYSVCVADDGKEGIDLYDNICGLEAVVTDIEMPVMDGNQVARYIRSKEKHHTPILAVTGSDKSRIEVELFDMVLHKPISINELKSALESIIQIKEGA